ncbi:Toxin RTX-I translocation ATP-binding protein [BD1-7 clade bacterium]|uniref:Toxin RTX-I translocation ATP-binding protein n=1 Tax=BD1-7 clade bacterium TaxID=2029982 RepID=A0A5S9QGZ0_9GAMM|nr:Toxin RTX-I translocation ATP-binding protein [BD1-7 clade bacterium]CAA0117107.1 Toxin RTX-I translocation ATP-binding protein [BD1-7 clade bacterium]
MADIDATADGMQELPGQEPLQEGGSDGTKNAESEFDSGLACFILMLKFLRIPADPEQFKHNLGKGRAPVNAGDILLLSKRIKVKAKKAKVKLDKLINTPLPSIAQDQDGRFFLLAKVNETDALIHRPDEQSPTKLSLEELDELWTGELILMTSRSQLPGSGQSFDVTWFIPALMKYRKMLGEVLVAAFMLQMFALITPLFFQVVIDKVLVHKSLSTLEVMVIGMATISLFEVLVGGIRTYIFSHTANRVDVELGAKLFRHLLALPLAYFGSRSVGQSVARVRELENIRQFLTSSSVTLMIDTFFTIVFFIVMYVYSPTLTLIVAMSLPFYLLISVFVTPMLRTRLDEKFKRGAENQSFLVESVTGVETLKAMALEPQMQRHWEQLLASYVSAGFKANMLGNFGSQAVQFVNKITTVLVLFIGANLVIANDLSVGQLVAFNMLAGRVAMPILRLSQLWQDFQQMRISVERLGDILNTPTEPQYSPDRANPPQIEGRIAFEDIIFRYRADGPEILKKVSLEIEPGEVIGIVGPSGSGKSTLAKLVQRLYVPEAGRVMVDGVDLALVDPAWLRRQIGVVLQENILFKRTVRENITLSDPTRSMEDIVHAAKLAGAHEFILKLPEGYDTLIDERGGNLSGGQRQRMAIARALITDPRILIFDEATSALDAESEEIIQNNLASISQGRTVMIIAHRLSAICNADRIITVEDGEITEEGTHYQLLEKGGRYAELWKKQMGTRGIKVDDSGVPQSDTGTKNGDFDAAPDLA